VSRTTWPLKLKSLILSGIDCLSLFILATFFFVDAPLPSNQRQRVAGQLLPAGMPGSFPFFSLLPGLLTKKSPLDGEGGKNNRQLQLLRGWSLSQDRGAGTLALAKPAGLIMAHQDMDGRTDGRICSSAATHTSSSQNTLLSFVWIDTLNCLNLDIIILLIKRHWTELIAHKVRCCCPVAKVIQLLNSPDGYNT
jgi:hypothetical protein